MPVSDHQVHFNDNKLQIAVKSVITINCYNPKKHMKTNKYATDQSNYNNKYES